MQMNLNAFEVKICQKAFVTQNRFKISVLGSNDNNINKKFKPETRNRIHISMGICDEMSTMEYSPSETEWNAL